MKGQLSLLVEGLRGQSVELFGRSEAFVSCLYHQLPFLDQVSITIHLLYLLLKILSCILYQYLA